MLESPNKKYLFCVEDIYKNDSMQLWIQLSIMFSGYDHEIETKNTQV